MCLYVKSRLIVDEKVGLKSDTLDILGQKEDFGDEITRVFCQNRLLNVYIYFFLLILILRK